MKGRLAVQVRRYGRSLAILVALAVVGIGSGFYILLQQRLPNPFRSFYAVNGAFPSAAAVVPALGEPVNVAGVHVGEITGTSLAGGQGIIHMQIDPSKMPRLYNDAHAELVPNTPLKDMEVDIAPGDASSGVLAHGATIPVAQTTSPVDADDLLASLDADTRAWLTTLLTELSEGTAGRGKDIRALFSTLEPTSAQLRVLDDLLAARRHELAQLVHNFGVVMKATSDKDAQLQTVVRAGEQTFTALASQDVALRTAITLLPATLQSTRTTLADLGTFSDALGPTATALLPSARRLPTTLQQTRTLFEGAALLPLEQIPSFVDAATPLASQLPPLTNEFSSEVPALLDSFKVLTYATNEFAFNPGGRNPGFLHWFAWFAHDSNSFTSVSDANGPAWRSLLLITCPRLNAFTSGPILGQLLGTTFGCR